MKTSIVADLSEKRQVTVFSEDDVEDVLERNKTLRGIEQKSDWGRHIATIPNIIMVQWLNEEWRRGNTGLRYLSKEWDRLVERKLRDPDWAFLRTDAPSHRKGWDGRK